MFKLSGEKGGTTFLDLENESILYGLFRFFENFYERLSTKKKKSRYTKMINYLYRNYYGPSALYPLKHWNYSKVISMDENLSGVTTNQIENLNLRLKAFVGMGYLSEENAYLKLKKFHTRQVALYTQKVVHNKMDLIKKCQRDREKNLLNMLNQFDSLTTEQKLANLEYFLLEFGTYTSEKLSAAFFDKTPQPDIKDLLSNSFNTDFDLSELFSH